MGAGVDFFRQPVQDRQWGAIASHGLERLVRLGVLDHKLKMESFTPFFEISMDELSSVGGVGITYCADLDWDRRDNASQKLIRDDARTGRGDPVETLVAGKIFEWQERDALHRILCPRAIDAKS